MIKKAHLRHIREALPFAGILIAGMLIFLVDFYELTQPFTREVILTLVSLTKSIWFVRFVVLRIRMTTEREFYFHEFMAFIGASIVLFILSFAIDFYCLYEIRPDAFSGISPDGSWINHFITFAYFSITNFTTTGMGDIVPQTTSARIFISAELVISFFFTIFIIANLSMLRESYARKNLKI